MIKCPESKLAELEEFEVTMLDEAKKMNEKLNSLQEQFTAKLYIKEDSQGVLRRQPQRYTDCFKMIDLEEIKQLLETDKEE